MASDGSDLSKIAWYWSKDGDYEEFRRISIKLPESMECALRRLCLDDRSVNSYIVDVALPKFIRAEEIEQRGVLMRAEVMAMSAWIRAREVEGLEALAIIVKIRAGEPVTDEQREQAERVSGMPLPSKKDESD